MGMAFIAQGKMQRWGTERDRLDKGGKIKTYVADLLGRFPRLARTRGYPILPRCLDGGKVSWEVSSWDTLLTKGSRFPNLLENERSWHGVKKDKEWLYPCFEEGLFDWAANRGAS